MLKRRTTTVAPLMPFPLLDLLLHGEMRPESERAILRAQGHPYNVFLQFTTKGPEREALWRTHRQALLDEWIRERPGTRPYAWWQFDAPGSRQRLGGTGDLLDEDYPIFERGLPTNWVRPWMVELYNGRTAIVGPASVWSQGWREGNFRLQAPSPTDPPRFESEAAYLARLGLLPDVERRRLQPAAFQPELVMVDEDDNVFVGDATDRAEDR